MKCKSRPPLGVIFAYAWERLLQTVSDPGIDCVIRVTAILQWLLKFGAAGDRFFLFATVLARN